MRSINKQLRSGLLASLLIGPFATISAAEEDDYVVDRELAIGAISWVNLNHEQLNWSSRNTVAIAVLTEIVNEHYQYDDEESLCHGLAEPAESLILSRQMNEPIESAWAFNQQVAGLGPSLPWPSELEREALLQRAYVETAESTRSGRAEQIVFFTAHEYEACVRQ